MISGKYIKIIMKNNVSIVTENKANIMTENNVNDMAQNNIYHYIGKPVQTEPPSDKLLCSE